MVNLQKKNDYKNCVQVRNETHGKKLKKGSNLISVKTMELSPSEVDSYSTDMINFLEVNDEPRCFVDCLVVVVESFQVPIYTVLGWVGAVEAV